MSDDQGPTTPAGDPGTPPPVGSVAEEAAKLLGSLQGWARETGATQAESLVEGATGRMQEVAGHVGHGEDCRYCPVCQALRLVRETSPEVRQHLASAVGSLAQAISLSLTAGAGTAPSTPPPPTERIDLDED